MKLIGSLTSPYVRKTRVVLAEKKLKYEFVLEDVWAQNSKIQQNNRRGKVPGLIMDDGGALFDSRATADYLDTLSPVGRLLPPPGRDRAAVKCWEAIADGVLDAAVAITIENHRRDPQFRSQAWVDRQFGKINAALDHMNRSLEEQPAFCMGVNFSLADVAVGCALGYLDLRFETLGWRQQFPNLRRLAAKLRSRPSFVQSAAPRT